MDIYFVATNASTAENEVIREIKPDLLLLSYFYFKNKPVNEFVELIGYQPTIMLDSGAYSAWTKDKNISLIDYMKYIDKNKLYINKYISLDVIGDPEITYKYYEIMRMKGFEPIPVYHYDTDINYLERYLKDGNISVALGNTVPIKSKTKIAEWINTLTEKYPNIQFHLLGSSSKKITENTKLKSCDSSTWIMQAVMGNPKHIKGKSREAKIKRAKWNMRNTINENKLYKESLI